MKRTRISFWSSKEYVDFLVKRKLGGIDMNKKPREIKVGDYDVRVVKKGFEEARSLGLKNGDVYYMVRIDKSGWMDVKEQIDAEILARQVRIEALLKKLTTGVYFKYPKYPKTTKYKWNGDKVEFSNELKGREAVDFVKKMKATEKRKPNKKEKYLVKNAWD